MVTEQNRISVLLPFFYLTVQPCNIARGGELLSFTGSALCTW